MFPLPLPMFGSEGGGTKFTPTTVPFSQLTPPQLKVHGSPVPQLLSVGLFQARRLSLQATSALPCALGSGILPGSQMGSGW